MIGPLQSRVASARSRRSKFRVKVQSLLWTLSRSVRQAICHLNPEQARSLHAAVVLTVLTCALVRFSSSREVNCQILVCFCVTSFMWRLQHWHGYGVLRPL